MQGEDSSDHSSDYVPHVTESQEARLADILRAAGRAVTLERELEHRRRQIAASALKEDDFFGGYIIKGMTAGCQPRLHIPRADGFKHTFFVRDCIHEATGESRVVKYPNPDVLLERQYLKAQIEHEQRMLALFDHPNIARQYGILRTKEVPYLVLEYLPFQVSEVIGLMPDMEGVLFFMLESTNALMELNRKGVVHGDIKEQQFMGCEKPGEPEYRRIKLIDFAGAIHPDMIPPRASYTPTYAAPEVRRVMQTDEAEKRAVLTHKADIHALGITVARLALQEHMDSDEISDLFTEPEKGPERAIEALYDFDRGSMRPPHFNGIVQSMVEPDPNNRPDAERLMSILLNYCCMPGVTPRATITKDLMSGRTSRVIVSSTYGGNETMFPFRAYCERALRRAPANSEHAEDPLSDPVTEDEMNLARQVMLKLMKGGKSSF